MQLAGNLVGLTFFFLAVGGLGAADKTDTGIDLYGDPLPRGATSRLGTLRFRTGYRHSPPVISPDGKWIASGAAEYKVFVWDSRTGKRRHVLTGHTKPINFVAFSPDSRSIVSVDWEGGVRCWNLDHGRTIKTMSFGRRLVSFESAADGKTALAYSDRGVLNVWHAEGGIPTEPKWQRAIASGRSAAHSVAQNRILVRHDNRVRLLDAETGKLSKEWSTDDKLNHADVSPNGRLLVMGYDNNAVEVRKIETDEQVFHNVMAHEYLVYASFSPDSKSLITIDYDKGAVRYWDLAGDKPPREIHFGRRTVARLNFFPDGRKMLLYTLRSNLIIVDAESGEQSPKLPGHFWNADKLRYSPDGKTIVSFSSQRSMIWDATTAQVRQEFSESVSNLAFSPDSDRLATAGYGGLRLSDLKTGESKLLVDTPALKAQGFERAAVTAVAFSPNGKQLVASVTTSRGERDPDTNITISKSEIRIWNIAGDDVQRVEGDPVEHLKFLSSGGHFIGISTRLERTVEGRWNRNRTIKLWDAETGKVVLSIACPTDVRIHDLAVSRDGSMMALSLDKTPLRVYRLPSGKLLHEFGAQGQYKGQVRFTRDGRYLVAGPFRLAVWNLKTGDVTTNLEVDRESRVRCFDVSPDSRYLVTGHDDGMVNVRLFATGELIGALPGHEGEVRDIAFAPDGKSFASMSADCTGLVWPIDPKLWQTEPDDQTILADLWTTLADPDAETAYQAVEELVALESATSFVGQQLRSRDVPKQMIAAQIKQLASGDEETRKQATAELIEIGSIAERSLRDELTQATEETGRLIQTLLRGYNDPVIQSKRDLQTHRAILVLERISTADALEVLNAIAADKSSTRAGQDALRAVERLRIKGTEK